MTAEEHEVRGRAPSREAEKLAAAATELAPHKSLERIDATAKAIVGGVSAIALVVSGLGALGSSALGQEPADLLLAAILTAISLMLATLALVPVSPTVAVGNLNAVKKYFRCQIKVRGWLVRASALVAALAYIAALIPILNADPKKPQPEVTVTLEGGGATPPARVSATIPGGYRSYTATMNIQAVDRHRRRTLLDVRRAGTGTLKLTGAPTPPPWARRLEVTVVGTQGDSKLLRQVSSLELQ